MKTASDIIESVGGVKHVADTLGIQQAAVRLRKSQGILPASWYAKLETMAGRPLPRSLFSFKANEVAK